jgi:hypothetical protein
VKELEDYNWFPSVLRNFQTEFIGFVVTRFNIYDVFVRHLKTISPSAKSMTDLCSGSGEPAITIFRQSKLFSHLSLSDKYPSDLKINNDRITYEKQSTDVLEMEFKSGTCYTMFNAFHHFRDEEKLQIIQKIQFSGSEAFFVEILEPNLICLVKVFFTSTIGNLVLTPFIRPFSFRRLLLTYVLPVNLLTITLDGVVSVLKSRSVSQYKKLFAPLGHSVKIYRLKNNLSALIVLQIDRIK